MKITFLDDFLYANGNVDNTFFIDIEGEKFPDSQWTDFSVIILNWWVKNVQENYHKQYANFTLQFMDGPYCVHCVKQDSRVHMMCVENMETEKIICDFHMEMIDLAHALIQAAAGIIAAIKMHKIEEVKGIDALQQSLDQLNRLIVQQPF